MCHVGHDRLAATRILLILGLFVQTIQVLANARPLLGRFAGTVGTGGLPSVHHGPSGHVRHLKHWFSSVKTLFTSHLSYTYLRYGGKFAASSTIVEIGSETSITWIFGAYRSPITISALAGCFA